MFDNRTTATVLAALREWQMNHPAGVAAPEGHFENHQPLSTDEIDTLCEQINTDVPCVVIVRDNRGNRMAMHGPFLSGGTARRWADNNTVTDLSNVSWFIQELDRIDEEAAINDPSSK
jgi:hypothetical protein